MHSVRRRLLLGAAVSVAAVLAALGVVLFASVRAWLVAEFDRGLLAQAQALAAATEVDHEGLKADFEGGQPAEFLGGREAQYFELWAGDKPAVRSASLGRHDLPFVPAGPRRPAYRSVTLPDGRPGRQISLSVRPHLDDKEGPVQGAVPPADVTLLVARDTAHLAAALARLSWLLGGACGSAVLACLGLMAWAVGHGLRPVSAIAARIERVGRRDLTDRLLSAGVPRELLPIVQRLNEMLERVESAFARERAFSADVAHELRTPLAGLEAALEVCSSRPRQPQEYHRTLGQCLTTVRQMHAMVDNLLVLARAEAGGLAVSRNTFSLPELIDESWRPFGERAAARGLRVTRTDTAGPITTDRDKLRIVLHNLFDNATSYADPGGQVRIELARRNGTINLTVANTGTRLSAEQAKSVFDRFWRGDASRTDTGAHCGLGLSISKELIEKLGGAIAVDSTEAGEFVARVTLPQSRPPRECE